MSSNSVWQLCHTYYHIHKHYWQLCHTYSFSKYIKPTSQSSNNNISTSEIFTIYCKKSKLQDNPVVLKAHTNNSQNKPCHNWFYLIFSQLVTHYVKTKLNSHLSLVSTSSWVAPDGCCSFLFWNQYQLTKHFSVLHIRDPLRARKVCFSLFPEFTDTMTHLESRPWRLTINIHYATISPTLVSMRPK
jgi:hypothetical protein